MKRILFATASCLIFFAATAQNTGKTESFNKGTNVLSALVGAGSSLGYLGNSPSPAISVNFEHGAWQAGDDGIISIGGYAGRKSFSYDYNYGSGYFYSQKWSYTIIGVRSAYHYTGLDNEKIDLYGGVMLSYNILSYSFKDNSGFFSGSTSSSYGSGTGFTGYIGGRYFFNPRIGANLELGYGVSHLNAGISLKF